MQEEECWKGGMVAVGGGCPAVDGGYATATFRSRTFVEGGLRRGEGGSASELRSGSGSQPHRRRRWWL